MILNRGKTRTKIIHISNYKSSYISFMSQIRKQCKLWRKYPFPICASVRSWLSKQTLFYSVFKYRNLTIFLLGPLGFLKFAKTLYSTLKLTKIGRTMALTRCSVTRLWLAWFASGNSQNLSNLRKQHTLHSHCLRFAEINLPEITFNFTFKIDKHGLQQRKPSLSHFLLDLIASVSEQWCLPGSVAAPGTYTDCLKLFSHTRS